MMKKLQHMNNLNNYMKQSLNNLLNIFIFVSCGILVWGVMFTVVKFIPNERVYDCSIAEISPDYTTKMREECRNLRRIK
jgi:hypothetical protein